jgi:hypothetical protein
MTKRREPLSYQLTLTRVAAAIGWDRCGAICGVSERAVRLWSDHDCETESACSMPSGSTAPSWTTAATMPRSTA